MNSSLVVEVLGSAILKLRVVMMVGMVVVMMFVVLVIIVVVVVFVLLVVVVLMVVSSSCSRGVGGEGWLSVRRILTISYNNL